MKITQFDVTLVKGPNHKDQVAVTLKVDNICSMASAYELQEKKRLSRQLSATASIKKKIAAASRYTVCAVLGEKQDIRFLMSWKAQEYSVLLNLRKVKGGPLGPVTNTVLAFLRMISLLPIRVEYRDIGELATLLK